MHGSPLATVAAVSCCCLVSDRTVITEHSDISRGNRARTMHSMHRCRLRQGSTSPSEAGLNSRR